MKTLIIAAALLALTPSAYAQLSTVRPLTTSTASATAPISVFASMTGRKVGQIKGEVITKGREGTHQILDIELGVTSTRDASSGLATGRRQHRPLRILKRVTAASPILFTSLVNNEILSMVKFDFWEANRIGTVGSAGLEAVTQTVTLENVFVSSWRQFVHPDLGLVEEVQFTYQKISIENKPGKTMGTDDWSAAGR